jgi:hypothetical protein
MTRTLKALIVVNVLGLLAFAIMLALAPPRVARDDGRSAFPTPVEDRVVSQGPRTAPSMPAM